MVQILFYFFTQNSFAQSLSLASYYPSSAFVVNRLLPFTISGQSGSFVKSVHLKSGDQCQAFIDPYYNKVFHIYCLKPSLVSADIVVSDSSFNQTTLSMGYINVFEDSQPGATALPAFKASEGEK